MNLTGDEEKIDKEVKNSGRPQEGDRRRLGVAIKFEQGRHVRKRQTGTAQYTSHGWTGYYLLTSSL